MNKILDLSQLGGYPFTQEDLEWMQTSYRTAFGALAELIGDKVIVAGMQEDGGGNVAPGWISIGGELVPFAAGTIGTGEFIIQQLSYPLTFKDGVDHNVRIERIASFSAGGPYQYSDLKRIGALKNMGVPIGGIIMWSGLIANIPSNYALCDGTNDTPNLGDKFILGYKNGTNNVGDVGGNKTASLITGNLPPISFDRPKRRNDVDRGGAGSFWSTDEIETLNVGGTSDPFSIVNPFYVLAFIQRKS